MFKKEAMSKYKNLLPKQTENMHLENNFGGQKFPDMIFSETIKSQERFKSPFLQKLSLYDLIFYFSIYYLNLMNFKPLDIGISLQYD